VSLVSARTIVTILFLCTALVFAIASVEAIGADAPGTVDRIVLTQIPAGADADAVLPSASRIVLLDPAGAEAKLTILTPGFDAAGRPDLSFDGRRMLFVARRNAGETPNVWELEIDGGEPRQVTRRQDGVTQAIYLSTLYTLDADAPHRRIAFCAGAGANLQPGSSCAALYTSRLDGTQSRQITFNPDGVGDPLLLRDGRLLYAGARPPGSGGGTTLFTVNTDGTDVAVFAAAHGAPAIHGMACETEKGHVVYVESPADPPSAGGSLVAVDSARSLGTRWSLTHGEGTYRSPSALEDGRLLVSYRPTSEGTFGVYTLDVGEGPLRVEVFDAPDWDEMDPVALRSRAVPKGRSSVVDERVEFGFLYCLDAYMTDREAVAEIGEGEIKSLRIHATGAVLGEIPVHEDGSFYLQIPARMPLRLETLDAEGEMLQAMENWIWVMPNERRGCVGCHEDRELTPPNRHVLALRGVPQRVGLGEEQDAEPAVDHPTKTGYPE